jgi:hypothetical protein
MENSTYIFFVLTVIVIKEYTHSDEYTNGFLNLIHLREGSEWIADYLQTLAEDMNVDSDLPEDKFYKECRHYLQDDLNEKKPR